MEAPKHVIQRLRINLDLPEEKSARDIQSQVRDICVQIITEILDEVFSDTIGNNSLLRIDKLSIDLGDLDRFFLERDFAEKLPIKLKEGLENCIKEQELIGEILQESQHQPQSSEGNDVQQLPPVISKLEVMTFFLLSGRLPWWEGLGKMNINELLKELLQSHEQEIKVLLAKIIEKPEVQKRINLQLSNENSQQLKKLLPEKFGREISSQKTLSQSSQSQENSHNYIDPNFEGEYSTLDLFSYFLTHGSVPYWGKLSSEKDLTTIFEELLKSHSKETAEILIKSIQKTAIRSRIIWQFSAPQVDQMIDFLAEFITSEKKSFVKEFKQAKASPQLKKDDYALILNVFSQETNQSSSHKTLVELIQKKEAESELKQRTSEQVEDDGMQTQPPPDTYDLLHYFFHQGHFPWWAKQADTMEPDAWVIELAKNEKTQMLELLDEVLSSPHARKRMLNQLKDETLVELLKLRAPQMSGFLMTLKQALDKFFEQEIKGKPQELKGQIKIEETNIRWEPVWIATQEMHQTHPSQAYTKAVIQYLSLLLDISFAELKDKFLQISHQAIEGEEVRFYPLVDSLETIEDDEPSETKSDGIEETEETVDKEGTIDTIEEAEIIGSGIVAETNNQHTDNEEDIEIKAEPEIKAKEQEPMEAKEQIIEDQSEITEKAKEQEPPKSKEQKVEEEKQMLSKLERGKSVYPKEVLALIQKPEVRRKLADQDYAIAFRRVLEILSPDEAETIIRFLQELTTKDPVLVAANKEQVLLKLASYDSTHLSDKAVGQKDTSSNMSMKFTLVHEESIFSSADAIYIGNAGMVILWPFLRQYFEMLDMLEGNQFANEEHAIRAVHLLQYLVTGETETPEYELVLNKILCNLPIDMPIPLGIELTEAEEDISSQMMNAILSNWSTIGQGTSVEGLREVFLLREGKLVHQPDGWHLQVTSGSYDMLLDTMPWGVSMVKLSWMQEMLYVEWR